MNRLPVILLVFLFLTVGCGNKSEPDFSNTKILQIKEPSFKVRATIQASEIRKISDAVHWGNGAEVWGFTLVDDSMNKKVFASGYDGPVEVILEVTAFRTEVDTSSSE